MEEQAKDILRYPDIISFTHTTESPQTQRTLCTVCTYLQGCKLSQHPQSFHLISSHPSQTSPTADQLSSRILPVCRQEQWSQSQLKKYSTSLSLPLNPFFLFSIWSDLIWSDLPWPSSTSSIIQFRTEILIWFSRLLSHTHSLSQSCRPRCVVLWWVVLSWIPCLFLAPDSACTDMYMQVSNLNQMELGQKKAFSPTTSTRSR